MKLRGFHSFLSNSPNLCTVAACDHHVTIVWPSCDLRLVTTIYIWGLCVLTNNKILIPWGRYNLGIALFIKEIIPDRGNMVQRLRAGSTALTWHSRAVDPS